METGHILGLGKRKQKPSLQHLVLSEGKAVLKERRTEGGRRGEGRGRARRKGKGKKKKAHNDEEHQTVEESVTRAPDGQSSSHLRKKKKKNKSRNQSSIGL